MDGMSVPSPADEHVRALMPDPDPEFAAAIVWARGDDLVLGHGGVTVLLDGPRRLTRLSALWRRAVEASELAPDDRARAWVSSTFADDSGEPAVLRVPATWTRVSRDMQGRPQTESTRQAVTEAALAQAVAEDPRARLLRSADPPLPDAQEHAWDDGQYARAVERILDLLDEDAATGLRKVVISRTETLATTARALWRAVDALRSEYPQTWVFAVGGLLGATPEMLATLRDGRVESVVLAGSMGRGATPEADAAARERLATHERLADEHRWAARSVCDALADVVDLDEAHPEPSVLTLPNVHHLATSVTGRLTGGEGTVLDVVARMHPTAAVGGTPTDAAVEVIGRVEPVDRGRYAGPVGWLDQDGDGEIALALRCAQQVRAAEPDPDLSAVMRLHAGGGIVAGAVAEEEVAEIGAKFSPMRRALGLG